MKRGATSTLKVQIDLDIATVSSVEFMLKQTCDESCTVKVEKTYPSSAVTYDATTKTFTVEYSATETRTFAHDSTIYLDVRPTLTNGKIVPTEIAQLYVSSTLYGTSEV